MLIAISTMNLINEDRREPSQLLAMQEAIPSKHDEFRIALYYCYVPINNLDEHVAFQAQICGSDLKGRVRVAEEGINGVLSGRLEHLEEYERQLRQELSRNGPTFDLDVKYCQLRKDLDLNVQLFVELSVQKTSHVVRLVEPYHEKAKQKRKSETSPSKEDYQLVQEIWSKTQEELLRSESDATPRHLSPAEWDARLEELGQRPDASVVLLDCRNSYESNVGHFQVPNATTLLTNTRKFTELPKVLLQNKRELQDSSHIFMYCTGGVRCERASAFLKTLLEEEGKDAQPEIYQLQGGIQRYIMQAPFGSSKYFRGKNFVFDPRRTDPVCQEDVVVGKCLLCDAPHDDYDNGHAPAQGREARCCTCRSLILVCNNCRQGVRCWGEEDNDGSTTITDDNDKPKVYCGVSKCLHKPPVKRITS